MSFDFLFTPPWPAGAVFTEGSTDRLTGVDRRMGCFAAKNEALIAQTVLVTMGVRIMTPPLRRPFDFISVKTDSEARGSIAAGALPGYARGRVEATVRVLDTRMSVLSPPTPNLFGRSSVTVPVFYGLGFPFSGVAFADTELPGSVGTGPLIVEVRINSWAIAYGNARGLADIDNACVTAISVSSS